MPEVMKVFSPFTTYSVPSRRAVVFRLATSEPPEGSVMASALIFSPARIPGSTRRLSSSLPADAMGGAPIWCENRLACTPPEPQSAISSESTTCMRRSAGVPPYSSGKPTPSSPAAAALR